MLRPGYQAPPNQYNDYPIGGGMMGHAVTLESWLQGMIDHATNNPIQWLSMNYNIATDDIVKVGPSGLYAFLLSWLQAMAGVYPQAQGSASLIALAGQYTTVVTDSLKAIPAAPWGALVDAFRVGGWPGSVYDQWANLFAPIAVVPAVASKKKMTLWRFWPMKRGK